jgi:hypothetical protein
MGIICDICNGSNPLKVWVEVHYDKPNSKDEDEYVEYIETIKAGWRCENHTDEIIEGINKLISLPKEG